ncbi:MAG: hypothetical protein OXK21_02260, partial [Chloroflexota bacterium]|nr:hypothetical protein [Chloroflexota bacterium]
MMETANVSVARLLSLAIIPFVSLFVLLAFANYALAQQTQGDRLTDFDIDPLPGEGKQDARGVCSDGTTLWVVEERKGKLFAYTLDDNIPTRNEAGDITIDFSSSSPQAEPGGCTIVGTTLYVADDGKDKLIAYNPANGDRTPSKDFNTLGGAGNTSVAGVTSDGTTMWVADKALTKLFAYALAD